MAFENPLAESGLPAVEGQIPVAGGTQFGHAAGDGAVRVDKVGGSQRCAAGLALVAVCFGIVAVRAFACHIAVGKELAGFGVIKLHRFFLDEAVVVVQAAEKFRCRGRMYVGSCA